ncbi:4697_t:CDS:1, partial [Entrophospora sp. SA101]
IDSWTSPLGQSIYAFVIITPARCQFIYSINDFSSDRHTAQFNEEQ